MQRALVILFVLSCFGSSLLGADDTPLGIAPPKKQSATAVLPPTQKFVEYRDGERGFKINYPEGWKQEKAKKDKDDLVEFVADEPDDDEEFVEVIRVGHFPAYAHSDLDGVATRLKEAFKRGPNAPVTVVSENDTKLAGSPAREIVMLGYHKLGKHDMKMIEVIGIVRGEGWRIGIGTSPRRFDRMSRLFDAVVASFDFIKPTIAVPQMTEFKDVAHGVKLKYPASWKKPAPASPKILFSFSSEGATGEVGDKKNVPLPGANVNLLYSNSPRPPKGKLEDVLDQMMESSEKQVKKEFPDVKWISLTTITPPGASARKLIYSAKANGSEFQVIQVLAMTERGATYTLTITTAADDYEQLLPIFDAVVNSLEIAAR